MFILFLNALTDVIYIMWFWRKCLIGAVLHNIISPNNSFISDQDLFFLRISKEGKPKKYAWCNHLPVTFIITLVYLSSFTTWHSTYTFNFGGKLIRPELSCGLKIGLSNEIVTFAFSSEDFHNKTETFDLFIYIFGRNAGKK